jgi:hypothetical protein
VSLRNTAANLCSVDINKIAESGLARLRGFKLDALSRTSVVTYRSSSGNMLKTSLDLLLVNTDSLIFNNTIRKMFAL